MELDPNTLEGFAKYKILNNDPEEKATYVIMPKKGPNKGTSSCVAAKLLDVLLDCL